jgi:hypothetical protein
MIYAVSMSEGHPRASTQPHMTTRSSWPGRSNFEISMQPAGRLRRIDACGQPASPLRHHYVGVRGSAAPLADAIQVAGTPHGEWRNAPCVVACRR